MALFFSAITFVILLCISVSVAEKSENEAVQPLLKEDNYGTTVGVTEQIISLTFSPSTVFLLQETDLGTVRQHQALAVEFQTQPQSANETRRILAGTFVPIHSKELRDDSSHFTFFIAGEKSSFAATEIRLWTKEDLKENSLSPEAIQRAVFAIEKKLKKERILTAETRENLTLLRNRAAQIAQVDEIISLKIKAEALQRENESQAIEIARLKNLIDIGRNLEEPEEANEYQKELALHLKEAAQVTAVADRLNRRKREAALQNFTTKVNLVKEMDSVQPEALAQEILRLRKKRRELENRMGITPTDSYSDEF